ncbi:hypothetical protein RvY_12356 [Ramazzottius varieornatus]|uniref:Uncharacterized protein n=1 Tax=Ramazzottius varieornatus TaxID=947166 RepID=A0A1D1VNF2_RAMVA|nr:hypothetical protein RvY_12356 [Ramazzottius varieornatus]
MAEPLLDNRRTRSIGEPSSCNRPISTTTKQLRGSSTTCSAYVSCLGNLHSGKPWMRVERKQWTFSDQKA